MTETELVRARQIEAGAILPGTGRPTEYDRDLISARHYRHPALADRAVVRLVPASLGVADDITMSYLGFTDPVRTSDVGVGRRQALGFPAWALINDPANAHHALNLVRELERLARQAKSSPGAARDGLMSLAEQLGRSAPHFLPTFYEQAGRIYLESGSTSYAATMFGKAREAEEVHNLTVDAERQRAVFLEFAFAGALTAKALSAYAKSLVTKHGPDEAYELFRTLCVERTRGGLPPYGGMPEDLRRLAKAAHRTLADEDAALLRAVLDTSAIVRAGAPFWKAYRRPLVALARTDQAVRYRLLSFVPAAPECHSPWLDILIEAGATDAVVQPVERAEPTPAGPAGWLTMFALARARYHYRGSTRLPALLTLVAAMAARLRADGVPVGLYRGSGVGDLDLLDLCLAEEIPLPEPPDVRYLDVEGWWRDRIEGARDLVAVATHPTLRDALVNGLLNFVRRGSGTVAQRVLEPLRAVPGLPLALEGWLAGMADRVAAAGLGRIERCLRELSTVAAPQAYVNIPDVARRIAATDVVGALTTALRGGIVDELGWPALEEGTRLLLGDDEPQPGHRREVTVCGEGWPALVLGRGERRIVVGPDGVLLDHVLRIPQDARRRWGYHARSTYVDGRLLVTWPGPEQMMAYWSDAPDQVFTVGSTDYRWFSEDSVAASIPLPDGGVFTGGRALHPGDGAVPATCDVLSDGTTYWALRGGPGERHGWREVDVATGDVGRPSLPAFLEDYAADGAALRTGSCVLRRAVPGTLASPLGQADGRHGWRVRTAAGGGWEAERIDGERITVRADFGEPRAAIRLPGDQRSRPVVSTGGSLLGLLDPDGAEIGVFDAAVYRPEMAAGTDLVPPLAWWHCLRIRDEAGSLALRSIGRDEVAALLAAAVADHADHADGSSQDPPRRGESGRLAELLPAMLSDVTHPGLVAGVLGVFRYAARLSAELSSYADIAGAAVALRGEPARSAEPTLPDATVAAALDWMARPHRHHVPNILGPTALPAIVAELASAARDRAAGHDVDGRALPDTGATMWPELVSTLPSVAYRAASALTPDADRPALLAALDALTHEVFATDRHWRYVGLDVPDPGQGRTWPLNRMIATRGGFLVLVRSHGHGSWLAVQYTVAAGDFALPAGWRVADATAWDGVIDRAWLAGFRAVLAERGPVPWRGDLAAELARRTGMSQGEALLLLAGLPHVGRYDRNFLPTALRTTLGMKAAVAAAARERLRTLPQQFCHELLAAAMPADPAGLWANGPDIAGLAAVWLSRFERSAPVPDELLAAAAKALPGRGATEVVTGLSDPKSCVWLNTDARATVVADTVRVTDESGFRGGHFAATAIALTWLAYVLPVGDPIRAHLIDAHDLAVLRSRQPDFVVELGTAYEAEDLCAVLGIAALRTGQVAEPTEWLVLAVDHYSVWRAYLRPARVRPEHLTLLDGVAGALSYVDSSVWQAMSAYGDPAVRAACAAVPPEGTDPAGYFQDPTLSAPDLVTAAAARLGISADAATLYLQLLALADPTDANVARWTGWKPARLKATHAELAATDLVLTAKRARAGRSEFLPGGWLALKNAHLPIEEWKKPMFRFTPGGVPIGPLVPPRPLADHFALAWQRVLDDDVPGYTELRTGGRK